MTRSTDLAALWESIRPRYPEFRGEVALVTGSARGIGKGIALRLAREGMKVVIHGLEVDEVDATTQAFQALGIEALGIRADLSDEAEIARLFDDTLAAFGTINLLVNNAADMQREYLTTTDVALLDRQLAVNVKAPFLCAQRAADVMRPAGRGSIISISSVGGTRAHWRGQPYDVTKGAIDAMTRALALDLAPDGIRANAIAPGAIHVERSPEDETMLSEVAARIPLARLGRPLDIGATVAFLASDDAAYITGQVIYVDGGATTQLSPPGQPI